jgi:hypothetical protein
MTRLQSIYVSGAIGAPNTISNSLVTDTANKKVKGIAFKKYAGATNLEIKVSDSGKSDLIDFTPIEMLAVDPGIPADKRFFPIEIPAGGKAIYVYVREVNAQGQPVANLTAAVSVIATLILE